MRTLATASLLATRAATMFSEGPAEYSALTIIEKRFAREAAQKLPRRELDGYLRGAFLAKWALEGSPYPTARDLYAELDKATPDSLSGVRPPTFRPLVGFS
jgi:hypothetical protein